MMHPYQRDFIRLALAHKALRFGHFTLKSGRQSPYFFNAGLFNTGSALAEVGRCYAKALLASGIEFDLLFGPAYKGIPLVSSTAIALAEDKREAPYCFNRKETKTHGEGGHCVGAPLAGRVMIVDDVITAGTAIRESINLIKAHHASIAGVIVALDRQECGDDTPLSAVQQLAQAYGITVLPVITLQQLLAHLQEEEAQQQGEGHYQRLRDYQKQYCFSGE